MRNSETSTSSEHHRDIPEGTPQECICHFRYINKYIPPELAHAQLPLRTLGRYYPRVIADLDLKKENIEIRYRQNDEWGRPHCIQIAYRSPTEDGEGKPRDRARHLFLNAADSCEKTAMVRVRDKEWYRGRGDLGASIEGVRLSD